MIGFPRALVLLHRTFRRHPPSHRLHILGRFLSAPFLRTLDLVPRGARVLDIGAGHGLLARLLVEERASSVVAVDPDLRKVLLAYDHPRVRFVAGVDDAIRGTFDVGTIYDVLYRLPAADRDALLRRAHNRVKPGGILIVKDLDPEARFKASWNRMQEWIADALHMTVGDYGENDTRAAMRDRLVRAGFSDIEEKRIDFAYPHAHIVYVSRKR
ncbi:MAG TPA: class I SAM-dependent methyltransferase [Thermoanaerobaculia bacterium]|nr:class I SAM-dependent methyltransferase [Thermoanaerobaculia bacterium]